MTNEENVSIDQVRVSLGKPLQVCFTMYPKSGDGTAYVADVQAIMYNRDEGIGIIHVTTQQASRLSCTLKMAVEHMEVLDQGAER